MRKLASIRKIKSLTPITGADRIELATVDGWSVVVQKGLHHEGDSIVYCEIDSFLPIREEFEFLRKSSYKKLEDGTEGFRLRTIKLRGQVSQGLILPITILGEDAKLKYNGHNNGLDVTEMLGITKWEQPIPDELNGVMEAWPSSVSRTDEERIQNFNYDELVQKDLTWFVTEKLDGTSCTMLKSTEEEFIVCGRNYSILEGENTYWRMANKYDVKNSLKELFHRGMKLAIQGEIIGSKYKINGDQEFRVFNIFDIEKYKYISKDQVDLICRKYNLLQVPIIDDQFKLPSTLEELLRYADGKSVLNPDQDREGLVFVACDEDGRRYSFKVISNTFLIEEEI